MCICWRPVERDHLAIYSMRELYWAPLRLNEIVQLWMRCHTAFITHLLDCPRI